MDNVVCHSSCTSGVCVLANPANPLLAETSSPTAEVMVDMPGAKPPVTILDALLADPKLSLLGTRPGEQPLSIDVHASSAEAARPSLSDVIPAKFDYLNANVEHSSSSNSSCNEDDSAWETGVGLDPVTPTLVGSVIEPISSSDTPPMGTIPNDLYLAHMELLHGRAKSQEMKKKE